MYNYQPLFSVECRHGYYNRGISPDLAFVPTPDCEVLLKKYGLFFRSERKGFVVLFKSQGQEKHLLEEGEERLKFSFYVKNRNYLFRNFSDLPFGEVGEVYHFQNARAKARGDVLGLHVAEKVSSEDLVNLESPQFQYPLNPQKMPKKALLQDEQGTPVGGILDGRTLTDAFELPGEDLNLLTLNLREEPPGRYSLLFDGKPEYDFYAAAISPMDCFGMLDIHFGGEEAKGYELIKAGSLSPRSYVLDFEARATIWKYYFIVQGEGNGFEPVKILELNNGKKIQEIPFSQPKKVQMNTGDAAYLLASQAPIRLTQLPRKLLLEFNRNGESGLQLNLPNPDVSQVKPDPDAKAGAFCSEMFVYV